MKALFTLLLVSIILLSNAQNRCGTSEYIKNMMRENPEYENTRAKVNDQTEKWINSHFNRSRKAIITIPVVVHVVWKTSAENISDAKIFDCNCSIDFAPGIHVDTSSLLNTYDNAI